MMQRGLEGNAMGCQMAETKRLRGISICLAGGLFTGMLSSTSHAAECFPGPDFQPPAGARWQYQRESATNKGCWYVEALKEPRGERTPTRSSGSNVASAVSQKNTKPAPSRAEQRKKAIEAVDDKDVIAAPAQPTEDQQQAVYELFRQWRLRQGLHDKARAMRRELDIAE